MSINVHLKPNGVVHFETGTSWEWTDTSVLIMDEEEFPMAEVLLDNLLFVGHDQKYDYGFSAVGG